jgi:tRNA(fMet)-specific endonuclease VapC
VRILDTDVCMEILRGNREVIPRRSVVADSIATTWITAAELYYGAAKSKAPEKNRILVSDFLTTVEELDLDLAAVQRFGSLKADLERRGRRLADADLFIASVALSRGAILVTGNRAHYARIPDLQLEDWLRP